MELKDVILSTLAEMEEEDIKTKEQEALRLEEEALKMAEEALRLQEEAFKVDEDEILTTEEQPEEIQEQVLLEEVQEKKEIQEKKEPQEIKEQPVQVREKIVKERKIESTLMPKEEPQRASIDTEVIYLNSIRERLLVLFEGFQAPNNTNIEAKLDLTLNFLEYTLATIDSRIEKLEKGNR